nr:reverse transcriptase domain-containing protein [Tanacetum cinerariifolium]
MIQQVQNTCQFHGLPGDDANRHIDKILEVTQHMKQNGVSEDALRLSLFPYSLMHHATAWYDHLPKNSIHTFDDTMRKFLSKYFPPSTGTKLTVGGYPQEAAYATTGNYNSGGKFTFPTDFVVIDYDVDPCVPLILGRPFLRTARALVDVHGEELILRDGDEQLIFHPDNTSKHPHKQGNESINMINFIDITCEDRFPDVLKFKKLNHPLNGSTTPLSDSSLSLTPFETSDSLLEEFADELALLDPILQEKEDNNFDFNADLKEIEFLLHQDPSTEDDDDDIFDLKFDNDEWKKLLYGDCYKDINSEKDKNKDSKMKSLVIEDHIVESNDLLPQILDNDSTLLEESSENASLSSSPFRNEDKVFNPGILILGGTQILKDESKDKDLILEDQNCLSISSDKELLIFLELTVIKTLLSFSSENEDKVFNPRILLSNRVHSFILELSHQTYENFKIRFFPSSVFASRTKEFRESQARDS